jgi:hypothetical protein
MAKIRPIIPGANPGTPGDPDIVPGAGGKHKPERKLLFRDIGKVIRDEWINSNGFPDRDTLIANLTPLLRLAGFNGAAAGNPNRDPVEFDIVIDPLPVQGQTKFVWIAIPAPEPPAGMTLQQYLMSSYSSTDDLADLGESVLFGCGR